MEDCEHDEYGQRVCVVFSHSGNVVTIYSGRKRSNHRNDGEYAEDAPNCRWMREGGAISDNGGEAANFGFGRV